MSQAAGGASKWYRPPTPTLYESVGEELDALELESQEEFDTSKKDAPAAWSPAVYAAQDDSDDELTEQFDDDEEDMHAYGIPAARGWYLDPRCVLFANCSRSNTDDFKVKVLEMFSQVLQLPGWTEAAVAPSLVPLNFKKLTLKRISGALTNAVFFVGYEADTQPAPPTLLLRIYGPGSENLLSRRTELLILHTLSSLYEMGPHILGTFANGRIEGTCSGVDTEFYNCESIGWDGFRNLQTYPQEGPAYWVARRMRELHEVPLDVIRTVMEQGDLKSPSKGFGRGIENHIMASSHRPRQRHTQRTEATSPVWQSYSYFAHPSPGLFPNHKNTSTMSFDSLATSYDSLASPKSALWTPSTQSTQPSHSLTMSPLALGPSSAPSIPQHGPYPGVWRRLKRWTRKASKVIERVNQFFDSPKGQVICQAFGVEKLPVTIGTEPRKPPASAHSLRATKLYFVDMMQALYAVDLPMLCLDIAEYKQYVRDWEKIQGKSRRVFCHNDSQSGNLLLLRPDASGQLPAMASGMPRTVTMSPGPLGAESPSLRPRTRSRSRSHSQAAHHRLVVIDFEYASPNPRAYDIANYFREWTTNYIHPTHSWSMRVHGPYPTKEERFQWLRAYVEHGRWLTRRGGGSSKLSTPESLSAMSDMSLPPSITSGDASPCASPRPNAQSPSFDATQAEVERLEEEVYVWSPAINAMWGLWGIVMAHDDVVTLLELMEQHVHTSPSGWKFDQQAAIESGLERGDPNEFDNLRFSLDRIEVFREELDARQVGLKRRHARPTG